MLAALIALAFIAQRPVTLGVLAVAGTFLVQRAGSASAAAGSGGGVSYSDALIAGAAVLSLPALAGTRHLQRLRTANLAAAVYLGLLLPTLIANQSTRADLEWAHRLVLVIGSLLTGAWIAQERRTHTALRLFMLVAAIVATTTAILTAAHGLHATMPFGFQKNFVGGLLGLALIIAIAGGGALELHLSVRIPLVLLLGAGLAASHSRGGMLAAVTGLLVVVFRAPERLTKQQVAAGVIIGAVFVTFAVLSVSSQLNQQQEDVRNSSLGVRFNVEKVTREVWRTSPLVGVGLKYFNTGQYGYYAQAANNDIDNELAESGVVGLVGFVVMQGGVMVALFRRREPLAAAALGVVAGQLLHGMVDIYWTAGATSLSFLIAGMALGARETTSTETTERAGRLGGLART